MSDASDLNARHRAVYDRMATRYAEVNATMPPAVLRAAEQMLAALRPRAYPETQMSPAARPQIRLLELGCGHGRDVVWFEAHGVKVVGADLSMGMLREAQSRVESPLVQLNMRHLPLADGTYDGLWCNAALLHLPASEVPAVLAEMHRVLVSGGVLYVALQVGEGEVWEPWRENPGVSRFLVRYAPAEVRGMVETAGFDLVWEREDHPGPGRHWFAVIGRRRG